MFPKSILQYPGTYTYLLACLSCDPLQSRSSIKTE